ncbi:MAG: M24 family metallopeptidase [Planctomycetota bacterium]
MIDLERAGALIAREGLCGWLFYDFQNQNPLARDAVVGQEGMLTRRWFCFVSREGKASWLVHDIERGAFHHVEGEVHTYARRASITVGLRKILAGASRIAMEYSPGCNIPYVSRVDAGTIELVRGSGVDVVSSGDLVQQLLAPWPRGGLASHRRAARVLEAAVDAAFDEVRSRLRGDDPVTECELQGQLLNAMDQAGLNTNHAPIVALGDHAADPHFSPSPQTDRPIDRNHVLMIDIWGREPGPLGVYADMTFMAYTGSEVPSEVQAVWNHVRDGRDAAFTLVRERFEKQVPLRGYEVDRAARNLIEDAGYGEAFCHRTGHSLGPEDHWIGANMDDYETRDDRRLVEGTGFTIEPGIYLPGRFGMRSEVDVFWGPEGPEMTTRRQDALITIT